MNTAQAQTWRARLIEDRNQRSAILPADVITEFNTVPDTLVNIAFADALLWVAARIETGTDATEAWLREQAFGTFRMVAEDIEAEREEA